MDLDFDREDFDTIDQDLKTTTTNKPSHIAKSLKNTEHEKSAPKKASFDLFKDDNDADEDNDDDNTDDVEERMDWYPT